MTDSSVDAARIRAQVEDVQGGVRKLDEHFDQLSSAILQLASKLPLPHPANPIIAPLTLQAEAKKPQQPSTQNILLDKGLNEPRGMVVFDNKLYVANTENNRIVVIDPQNGNILNSFNGSENPWDGQTGLHNPTSLAIADDLLYVAESGSERVSIFRVDGIFVRSFAVRCNPYGICLSQGLIIVTDPYGHRLRVFDQQGKLVRSIGNGQGRGDGQLQLPWTVAADGDEIYVVENDNHRVSVFKTDGTFVRKFGRKGDGNGQMRDPMGLCLDGGFVHISDQYNHRVVVFRTDGTFVQTYGEGQLTHPKGLTVAGNTAYVCSIKPFRICTFTFKDA
jgi:YVTN family beta-propeller protein